VQTASLAATPAMIRDAVAAVLRPASCNITRAAVEGSNVVVTGLASRSVEPGLLSGVRDAMPPNAAPDAVSWHLDMFDGPYCGALDAIRTAATTPLSLSLRNGARRLRKDDDIVPQVVTPDFPAWLQVDYFSSDGGVAHLHPTALGPARQIASRTPVTLGDTAHERWQVDAPFGTDMVVAIASSTPLFSAPRPANETTDAYIQALRTALADAARKGVRVSASAILVDTSER
jgi:eukaryotic-like serine/threonine-protein kinase